MIKSRHPLFNKTITKYEAKNTLLQPFEHTKIRTSNLKFPKKNQNLTHIIRDLEKNVRQLRLYHQSLQKTRPMRLQKSSSVNQIQRLKKVNPTLKNTTKSILTFKRPSTSSNITKNNQRLSSSSTYPQRQQLQAQKNVIIESTISKCPILQNGSTMLSIHNADIDQVKRAYLLTHGKNTSNIVDLYNFFKKNVEKSTRIHGSTYLAEHQPENQQDMMKSHLYRKSSEIMNVIVQDKVSDDISQNLSRQSQSIYKISAQKNPVMEQIFKNGCPDLANVYEYVQKRRVSIKNYMNLNKGKQTTQLNKQNDSVSINCNKLKSAKKACQTKQVQELRIPPEISPQILSNKLTQKKLAKTNIQPLISSPILRMSSIHNESPIGSAQLSQNKYLPSISSKKSQKSSLKKSKQKQPPINLDQNILQNDQIINEFNAQKKQENGQKHLQNKLFDQEFYRQLNKSEEIEKKQQKFKKSKYYVEPIPVSKQNKEVENSLEGCEISVKSSSRIIQLDFIPLDL